MTVAQEDAGIPRVTLTSDILSRVQLYVSLCTVIKEKTDWIVDQVPSFSALLNCAYGSSSPRTTEKSLMNP